MGYARSIITDTKKRRPGKWLIEVWGLGFGVFSRYDMIYLTYLGIFCFEGRFNIDFFGCLLLLL